MRKGKRFLTLILALALLLSLWPQSIVAAEIPQDSGGDSVKGVVMQFGPTAVTSSMDEYTFDISEGNITICDAGAGMVSITYGAEQIISESFVNTQQIIITGNTNSNVVTIEEGVTANITLENVDIDVSAKKNDCAFSLSADSSVSLTLAGINALKSGNFMAGLAVPITASLLIMEGSTGELMASGGYGAGIGGGDNSVNGEITISGGFVNATGRYYSAGIGGGYFSTNEFAVCGLITITGGVVTATGGEFAAGIGGGQNNSGNVVITGGTVVATGGRFGAGIGGGLGGNGTVVINDGNVKAMGGIEAAGIGGSTRVGKVTINGGRIETDSDSGRGIGGGTVLQGCEIVITGGSVKSGSMGVTPTNGESPVYLATVGLYGITAQTMTYSVDGEDEITLDTPDGRLYLWLTEGDHTISVRSETDEYYGSEFTVQANNDNRVSPTTDATSVTDGSIVITSAGGYVITGSTTVNSISVSNGIEGDIYITLEDVNIDVSAVDYACAFSVGEGSSVILTLKGTNTLKSGANTAGLAVPSTASLRIAEDSAGELTAVGGAIGAGIGGGNMSNGGSITIQGGTITAMGGLAGAGIGGGQFGDGGNVTIEGGIVTATSEFGGAGIGGGNIGNGGNVTIEGGTVTAAGGYRGAGIGGGINGSGGNVIISGGTVKALAGAESENIGKGYDGTDSGILKNLSSDEGGTDVFLTTVTLAGITTESAVSSLSVNLDEVIYSYGITGIFADATGKLYLYLPEGAEVAAVQTSDVTYIGLVATTADHLAAGTLSPDTATQLAVPESLAWDVMTPGKATWMADASAISYDVQLYKGGTALGDPVNAFDAEHVFISAIEDAGTGVYTFSVKAIGDGVNYTDSTESPVSAEYSYIAPPTGTAPTITTAILSGGTVDVTYSQTLAADGDTPIIWSIKSGSLPDGLNLSGNTISGTPTTEGAFDFTVEAENAAGSDTQALSILVNPAAVTGAAISPDTASFDMYSPADTQTIIAWNSASTVTDVVYSSISLTSGTDYTVTGDTLTIKKEYMAMQSTGSLVLTVEFDVGDAAMLVIDITDSKPPSISPEHRNYDLSNPQDVSTIITWNSASTVTDVVYGTMPLTTPHDYVTSGSALTILDTYLSGLSPSAGDELDFIITFDTTENTTLTVKVVENYTPSDDADLSDLTVGGGTISGFDADITSYIVELPHGTLPDSAATLVNATANDPAAQVSIAQASVLPGSATVTVTAEDGTIRIYTINFTLGTAPITTYTITATAGSSGSISPSGAVNVTEGSSQTFTTAPNTGYRISSVTVDGANQGAITTYTFTNVTANHTIIATFSRTSGGGGGGGSTLSTPTVPDYEAEVIAGNGFETTLPVTVDKDARAASIDLDSHNITLDGTVVTIPPIPGASTYSIGIPVPDLSSIDCQGALTLNTDTGSITAPSNMLTGVSKISGSKAEISIGKGDIDNLPDDVQAAVGDRKIIQLTMTLDGVQTEWSNPNAPVLVSIPYTPATEELADPEYITVWYIDGSGNVVEVPSGKYDPVTGMVTFSTTHFSNYAVVYVTKTFDDLGSAVWAKKPIEVLASKGILRGISEKEYNPQTNITRADFLYFLIRTLSVDAKIDENFDDISSDTYYYKEIAIAKRLGIASGTGNNKFSPDTCITRQDMMVLTERALRMLNKLEEHGTASDLDKFADNSLVVAYAVKGVSSVVKEGLIVGSGGKVNPLGNTTRAEAAAFLYRIYDKY